MRQDVFIKEVVARCEALKYSGFWPSEPTLRPRAWLNNFREEDRFIAAMLLNRFTYYDDSLTDRLLISSYHSLADGLSKGPLAPSASDLLEKLETAVFTPVEGERPNPTDSGNLLCRKARQVLGIPEDRVLPPSDALKHAIDGGTVVFLDDFIGSGDQFIETWKRDLLSDSPKSFEEAHGVSRFCAAYITLVSTDFGLAKIHERAPNVAVCPTHILGERATYKALGGEVDLRSVREFLIRYSEQLRPNEHFIAKVPSYRAFGYKERGLLFGFEHSIPDATLPVFWSPGLGNWEPLIERR